MNQNIIKEEIKQNLNKYVNIKVYGMRNKINEYEGTIKEVYPNIFTIKGSNFEKSFNYRDVITGDIKITYH